MGLVLWGDTFACGLEPVTKGGAAGPATSQASYAGLCRPAEPPYGGPVTRTGRIGFAPQWTCIARPVLSRLRDS